MRRIFLLILLFSAFLPLFASGRAEESIVIAEDDIVMEGDKMIMTIDGRAYEFTLSGTATARGLKAMLPLELEFEDFAASEKISYTPQSLPVSESGHSPKAGDLCVYVPWGNLCLFYKDYHYSDELVFVGRLSEGIEEIAAIRGGFSASLK